MNLYKFHESVANYTYYKLNLSSLENYIDIDVLKWLIWLFTPVVVSDDKHHFICVFLCNDWL